MVKLVSVLKPDKVHGSFDFESECTAPIPTSTTPVFSTTVTMAQSTISGNGSGGNGNGSGSGNGSNNNSQSDDEESDQIDQSETTPELEQTTVAPPTTPFVIKHKERQCCGEFPNRAPYHKDSFITKTECNQKIQAAQLEAEIVFFHSFQALKLN